MLFQSLDMKCFHHGMVIYTQLLKKQANSSYPSSHLSLVSCIDNGTKINNHRGAYSDNDVFPHGIHMKSKRRIALEIREDCVNCFTVAFSGETRER